MKVQQLVLTLILLFCLTFSAWWNATSASERAYYFIEHDENNNPLSYGYIWIKGDFSTTPKTFYVYYNGNSEDTSMKNGSRVFNFFDEFNSNTGLYPTCTQCYWSDGKIQIGTSTATGDLRSNLLFGRYARFHAYCNRTISDYSGDAFAGLGIVTSSDYLGIAQDKSGYTQLFTYDSSPSYIDIKTYTTHTWEKYTVYRTTSQTVGIINNNPSYTVSTNNQYTSTSPLLIRITPDRTGNIFRCDWLAVMDLSSYITQSSTTYGSEQTGSWTLNGITYTKRKQVSVSTSATATNYQVALNYSQFNSTNIAITSYSPPSYISIFINSTYDDNGDVIKRPYVKIKYSVSANSNITSIKIFNNITSSTITIYPNANNYTEERTMYFTNQEGFYNTNHYYKIQACISNSCQNSSTQTIQRLQNITIGSLSAPNSMIETTTQYAYLNITHRGYFTSSPTLVSKLNFDGLNSNCSFTLTNLSTSNELLFRYQVYCPFTSRLQDTNNTQKTATAYINFTYSQAGTPTLLQDSKTKSINILFGAYPTTMLIYDDINPYITEMDTFRIRTNIINTISATVSLQSQFNGQNYTGSNYGTYFVASATTPALSTNTNYNVVSYLTVSKNGDTKIRTKTTSFTAYRITISTCSDTNGFIRFDTKYINGTTFTSTQAHNIYIKLDNGNKTYNTSFTGTSTKICITPKQFYTFTDEIFFSVGSKNQEYYIYNHKYNTSSNNIVNLYGNDGSYIIDLTVYENSVSPKPNVIVELIRYNPTTFQSYTVEMGKTNSEGKISLFFTNNGYYKFNIYDTNGVQLYSDLPTKLYTSTGIYYKTIYLSTHTATSPSNIIAYCIQNITTSNKKVTCDFYSLDGAQHNFTLILKNKNTIVNSSSIYTSSGSLTLTSPIATDGYLYAHSEPTPLFHVNLRNLLTHDIEYSIIAYPIVIFITLVSAYNSIVGIILLVGTGLIFNSIPEFESALTLLLIPAVVMLIIFLISHYKRS